MLWEGREGTTGTAKVLGFKQKKKRYVGGDEGIMQRNCLYTLKRLFDLF